ncbi:MAG: hypothetical protein EPN93_11885 [Spirochaetes bacterium]|nr:MAG: hypothetical protein EPN93_11885 [Spirochaetota bacterium]
MSYRKVIIAILYILCAGCSTMGKIEISNEAQGGIKRYTLRQHHIAEERMPGFWSPNYRALITYSRTSVSAKTEPVPVLFQIRACQECAPLAATAVLTVNDKDYILPLEEITTSDKSDAYTQSHFKSGGGGTVDYSKPTGSTTTTTFYRILKARTVIPADLKPELQSAQGVTYTFHSGDNAITIKLSESELMTLKELLHY